MNNVIYLLLDRHAEGEDALVAAFFNKENCLQTKEKLEEIARENAANEYVATRIGHTVTLERAREVCYKYNYYDMKEMPVT